MSENQNLVASNGKQTDHSSENYINVIRAIHKCSLEEATQRYAIEKYAFQQKMEENPALKECTRISINGVFLEVISNGLSFEKSANHVYLQSRNVNVKSTNTWEKRLAYSETYAGLIYLTLSAGSIVSCSTPVLAYECDKVEWESKNGKNNLSYKKAIPRTSNRLVGGFCYVETKNGIEPFWMDVAETDRMKKASEKSNSSKTNPDGKANALYSSGHDGQIDEGMFRTKIVKFALKIYPKKRIIGSNHIDEIENEEDHEDPIVAQIEARAARESNAEEIQGIANEPEPVETSDEDGELLF